MGFIIYSPSLDSFTVGFHPSFQTKSPLGEWGTFRDGATSSCGPPPQVQPLKDTCQLKMSPPSVPVMRKTSCGKCWEEKSSIIDPSPIPHRCAGSNDNWRTALSTTPAFQLANLLHLISSPGYSDNLPHRFSGKALTWTGFQIKGAGKKTL